MQLISLILAAGLAQAFATGRSGQRLRKSVQLQLQASEVRSNQVANHSSLNPEPRSLPVNLAIIAEQCKCKFVGLCTCNAAVEFMDCVADACASGVCECQAADFVSSCNGMVQTCPEAELACSQEKATCTHIPKQSNESVEDITNELDKLKERKCMLLNASNSGYLNANRRLRELEPIIQGKLDLLKERGAEAFYMGCVVPPSGSNWTVSWIGGEASAPPVVATTPGLVSYAEKKSPTLSPAPASPTSPPSVVKEQKRFWIIFGKITVYLVFVILAAFLYDRVRKDTVFPQKTPAHDELDGFSYGLFGCFSDWKLSVFSCICPALRWADTMDKAGENGVDVKFIDYWKGFALVLTLGALNLYIGCAALFPFGGMCFGLLLVFVNAFYRQKLRRRYQLSGSNLADAGSPRIYLEDFFTWLCCPCCAMVQEARQVEGPLTPYTDAKK